jgi:hypothetical protein
MSKIIKKQIKRSLPIVLILLLLNLSIYGILFNLNFQFKPAEAFDWLTAAKADTASSTVTVRNASPAFTVSTVEVPVSSSTSPVNIGGTISFQATADDQENNSYYLVVCSTNSVSPGAGGGQPTCAATRFCVSSLTADTNQATCVYSGVTDPPGETRAWYSFVCDNHSSEAECSTSNQGSGDSGSPFWLNHAPVFTSASTTDNLKNPGGIFTVTGYVTDGDTEGSVDDLSLYVCDTNVWATSTGCGGTQLCTGTSTTPDISCQFTDAAPTPHGDYTYYAFVKDWHEMPATGNSHSASYTINNVAPTVGNVILNNGNDIYLSIKNAPEKIVWATSTSVSDDNGCNDIVDGTSTIYMSNATSAQNCAANDNDCYLALAADCNISDCGAQPDSIATMACSVSLAYHAIPTDSATGTIYAAYNWLAAINAYDENYTGSAISTSTVEVVAAAALGVTETTIPYGIIVAGQNTGTNNATTTVVNFGNTPLDNYIEGTSMVNGPNAINENNQQFDLSNFNWSTGTFTLSSTTPQLVNIDAARPTSAADVSDQIFWGLGVPLGILSGDYTGTNTFTAALDPNGVGW